MIGRSAQEAGEGRLLHKPANASRVASRVFECLRGPIVPILATLLAFIGFIALQSSVPLIDYQLNADSMYVLMIVKDILFDGGALRDWFTSVHLFLYPDMILALPILLMQKMGLPVFIGCVAAYGFLLISLTAFAWYKITKETLPQSLWAGSVLFGIVFCGDYLLYKLTAQQAQTPELVTALKHTYAVGHVLGPALHSGAFILTFLLFFALEGAKSNAVERSFSGSAVLLACISCNAFLVTLSDLMFVPWGIIPLSFVVLCGVRRTPVRKSLLIIFLLWVPATLGYLVSLPISSESTYVAATGRPLSEALGGLIDFVSLAASIKQPTVTFFLGVNVLLWCAGAYSVVRELICPMRSVGRCLIVLAASMSASSILAPAAAGLFTGWQIRYLVPYLFLGPTFCVFVIFLGLHRLITSASWATFLSIASLTIFAAGIYTWTTLPGSAASQLVRCLNEQGLKSGRAGFWDAAPIVVASGWRLTIAPLVPGTLDLYSWLTNRRWLQPTDHNASNIFLVLQPDLARRALEQYGSPDQNLSCAGRRLLIYNHPPARYLPDAKEAQ